MVIANGLKYVKVGRLHQKIWNGEPVLGKSLRKKLHNTPEASNSFVEQSA